MWAAFETAVTVGAPRTSKLRAFAVPVDVLEHLLNGMFSPEAVGNRDMAGVNAADHGVASGELGLAGGNALKEPVIANGGVERSPLVAEAPLLAGIETRGNHQELGDPSLVAEKLLGDSISSEELAVVSVYSALDTARAPYLELVDTGVIQRSDEIGQGSSHGWVFVEG